jgi:hypothetical protein
MKSIKQGSHTAIKGGGERHNDKSTSEPIMARRCFCVYVLFFDIDCKPGFEFHSEVVGKDGDLLDELFYQSFVELCDVCFLLGDKVLQFLDPVHGFFPVVAVDLGLFLLFPESEDFVSDGIVVLFVVCLLDELFLQFFQPSLDAVRREGVSADYSLGDIGCNCFRKVPRSVRI